MVTGASRGIGAAVAYALVAEGPVDILVNNAGTSFIHGLDLPDEEWTAQWELHVMSSLRLMRALVTPTAACS